MRNKKIINIKHLGLFALLATVAVYGMDQEAPTTSESRASSSRAVYQVDLDDPELYPRNGGMRYPRNAGFSVHGYRRTSGSVVQEPCAEPAPQDASVAQEPAQEEQAKPITFSSLARRGLYNLAVGVGKNIGGFIIENPKTAAVAALVGVIHFEPNSIAYLGHTGASVAHIIINNFVTQEAMYQFSIFLCVRYSFYFFDQNPWTRTALQVASVIGLCYDPTAFAAAVWNSLCYI